MRAIKAFAQKLMTEKRGSIGVISALTILMLCGIVGLGADAGVWYANRHKMQTMAEITALSAARLLSNSSQTTASITAVAKNDAVLNGLTAADAISVGFSPRPRPMQLPSVCPLPGRCRSCFPLFFFIPRHR
jgi:Flp pilus assembly protein TadG